jgi:hypothetical protein
MTQADVVVPGAREGSAEEFTELPERVLGPLAALPAAEWHRAPPGKWSVAQIVEHLVISLETSGLRFEERRSRPAMRRRRRGVVALLGYWLILRLGWFPRGFPAPPATRPGPRPDEVAVARRFHEGHRRFTDLAAALLPARRHDLFVKHPVIGDLTLVEWQRFHVVHCRHHARQIRQLVVG